MIGGKCVRCSTECWGGSECPGKPIPKISTTELQPILKWAGGKRHLVPRLRELYAPHRHRPLVEPFVGGMAVALGLRPEQAVLTDVNPHLINFYQQVQRGLVIDIAMDAVLYYSHRDHFNDLIREGERIGITMASLFYYLNRTCFNGLCRFNKRGEFNVPVGKYKTINYQRDFREHGEVLSKWLILRCDFSDVALHDDQFYYLDPPYDVEFTSYSSGGFSWGDQVKLAEKFAACPGPVVASNQATPRILALYRGLGYDVQTIEAPRRIACNGDRQPALEMLATKNLRL